jgi:septum formation protein
MAELILASGSRFRRQMLEQAGVRLRVQPPDVDETALKKQYKLENPRILPTQVAMRLAVAKATTVSALNAKALVIGSDQVLDFEGRVLSKPRTVAAARKRLLRLRCERHRLPTAVVLVRGGAIAWQHLEVPQLTMRNFSDAFLDTYLAAEGNAVTETAGGYKIEALGAQLFESIEGDYFSIIGLPLLPLLAALRQFGELPR